MPSKKRTTGYEEGPGFDRKPFDTGFQQGTLFRREAPARANLKAERDHLGPAPDEQARYIRHRDFGAHNRPPDQNATPPEDHDLRQLKGRVTGAHGFDLGSDLYHGTAARLKPGSLITPGRSQNFSPTGESWSRGVTADKNREQVFATPSMANAFSYAQNAKNIRETRGNAAKGNARAYVYRVQPTGPAGFDKEDSDARLGYSDPGDETMQFQSRHPLRVLHPVQFHEAQESYRSYMEDELGNAPGDYPHAPRVRQQELW